MLLMRTISIDFLNVKGWKVDVKFDFAALLLFPNYSTTILYIVNLQR